MAIHIPVGIRNSGFKAGLDDMRREAKKFAGDLRGEFLGSFSGLRGQLVGALGIGAIGAAISGLLSKAGDIQDLSERFDASAESLQRIGNVAAQNGSSMESVGAALNKLALNQEKVREGSAEMQAALATLGIEAAEFINLAPEQAFYRVADATQSASDRQAAYAAVVELMGKSSGELFTTLELGSDTIRELGDSIGVYADETIARLDEMGDAIDAAKNRFTVAAAEIGLQIDRFAQFLGRLASVPFGGSLDDDKLAKLKELNVQYRDLTAAAQRANQAGNSAAENSALEARAKIEEQIAELKDPKKQKPARDLEAEKEGSAAEKAERAAEKARADLDRAAQQAAERRARLQKEIADAEFDAESDGEKLRQLRNRQYELNATGAAEPGGARDEAQLEQRKEYLAITRQIADLEAKMAREAAEASRRIADLRKQAATDEENGRQALEESLARERDNAFERELKKKTLPEQRDTLLEKRDKKYTEAARLDAANQPLQASQARIEAETLQERIDFLDEQIAAQKPEQPKPDPLARVSVDSLQAIGGGGGIGSGGGDPLLREQQQHRQILERIAHGLETGKIQVSGPLKPATLK